MVRTIGVGGSGGVGAIRSDSSSAVTSSEGAQRRGAWRTRAGSARRTGDGWLAVEECPAGLGAGSETQAGVPVAPVQEQLRPQLGLGIGRLFGGIGDRRHGARQHGAALDEDELRGHRHKGADVRQMPVWQGGQSVEVRTGQFAEGHLKDVQLALLDERQQHRQWPVEGGELDVGGAVRL